MEELTALVALAGVGLLLIVTPLHGLIVYLAVLFLYPDYLRVSLGTLDISATRIIISVLLVRSLADKGLTRRFQWNLLDTLVALELVVGCLTLSFTTPDNVWIENRAGYTMDTLLVYFAVRLVVCDRRDIVVIAKASSVMIAFLAVSGLIEAYTGQSIYSGLGQYCPWAPSRGSNYQVRFGLNRAEGPFGETIMFGIFFASMFPLIWLLRREPRPWGNWCFPLCAACIGGVLSTVSSGPYVALAVVIFCVALERAKSLVKPLIALFLLGCIAVEVLSNRHAYAVLGELIALDPDTAWYRSQLINIAIKRLPEYWSVGYGFTEPGWGLEINELKKTDVVNHYVYLAVLHGLPGLFVFMGALAAAWRAVIRSSRRGVSPWCRSLAWGLGSTMTALMVAIWSVALFTQMVSVFYVLLALQGALYTGFRSERVPAAPASRPRGFFTRRAPAFACTRS